MEPYIDFAPVVPFAHRHLPCTSLTCCRAAQIRAGIWRRNGPGMSDQVLNYSEPPFCRPLADADVLMLQFALICHAGHAAEDRHRVESADANDVDGGENNMDLDNATEGLAFGGMGTLRLVNLLLHRFG